MLAIIPICKALEAAPYAGHVALWMSQGIGLLVQVPLGAVPRGMGETATKEACRSCSRAMSWLVPPEYGCSTMNHGCYDRWSWS
jgi:hypothetical protein